MQVFNVTKGVVVAARTRRADTFFSRLKGLLGSERLLEEEGLIIFPCNSVHTFGMRYAIDVLFVDKQNRIIKIVEEMGPGRMAGAFRASFVIELPAGTVAKGVCQAGDFVEV
jgi:uncharacterized membrane protein (UPF0127 family)